MADAPDPQPPSVPAAEPLPPGPAPTPGDEARFFEAQRPTPDEAEVLYRLRNEKLEEELADLRSDRDFRREYAPKIYRLIGVWLLSVVALVVVDGVEFPGLDGTVGFDLSDAVVLALIGGTTVSVIGLLVIVITYIFPRRNQG